MLRGPTFPQERLAKCPNIEFCREVGLEANVICRSSVPPKTLLAACVFNAFFQSFLNKSEVLLLAGLAGAVRVLGWPLIWRVSSQGASPRVLLSVRLYWLCLSVFLSSQL